MLSLSGEYEPDGVDSRVMIVFDFPYAEEGKILVAYVYNVNYNLDMNLSTQVDANNKEMKSTREGEEKNVSVGGGEIDAKASDSGIEAARSGVDWTSELKIKSLEGGEDAGRPREVTVEL